MSKGKEKNNRANSVDESEKLEYGQLSKACTLELAFIISSNSLGNKKSKPNIQKSAMKEEKNNHLLKVY